MNRSIKILLAALLTVSSQAFAEVRNIDKTFVALRDQRNRAAHMTTFASLAALKNDDRLCGAFQVTGFYNGGSKSTGLGEALMKNGQNWFKVDNTGSTALKGAEDGRLMVRIGGSTGASVTADSVAITPEVSSYGVLLKYNQQLDGLAEGLWFAVNAPVANVSTNVNLVITNPSTTTYNGLTGLAQYFAGTAGTTQDALKKSKMDGKAKDRTELGDVEVQVGWNFIDSEKHQIGINAGVHFPTGTKPTAEYLFEPTVGSVHWALGAGFNANATVWEGDNSAIKFLGTIDYRYLLEDTETRMLEIAQSNQVSLGRWTSLAKFGATSNFIPAANVLARDFNITPGSQVDAIAAFAYNNGGFSIDLGYNLFFKDAETGALKVAWTDNVYGIPNNLTFAPGTAGSAKGSGATTDAQNIVSLNNAEEAAATGIAAGYRIDQDAALTPSVLTHKVFAGAGYTASEWDYPVMVGVGGSYEFANEARTSADGFGVWGKLGVAF